MLRGMLFSLASIFAKERSLWNLRENTEMSRRGKIWEIREDIRPLLKRTKKLFPTLLEHVKTHRIFLCGFQNPNAKFVAQIRRNAYPWALTNEQYDYSITFWSTRFDSYRKSRKLYVILHELLHIPNGGFEKGNRHTYRKLVKHNIEDFSMLRHVYGLELHRIKDIYLGEKHLLKKNKDRDEELVSDRIH